MQEFSDLSISVSEQDSAAAASAYNKSVVAGSQETFALAKLDVLSFIEKRKSEGLDTYSSTFLLKGFFRGAFDVIEHVRSTVFTPWDFTVTMADGGTVCLERPDLFVVINKSHTEHWFYVWGSQEICKSLKERIGKDDNRLKINWWFVSDDDSHFDERDIDFQVDTTVKDEYYPYIRTKEGGGASDYLRKYMESKASVLLCMGEPGTGKTSLLRHLISEYRLNAVVTYDEKIMASDYFYCQFLTDAKKQLLILEDADVLLGSRERTDNRTMNKLLNVSDGLIQLAHKKIVFTTNLDTVQKMDSALLRPGRCFDVLSFRKLTFEEAQKASEAAGLPPLTEDKEYALTDVFNRQEHSYYSNKRVGFK